MSYRYEKVRRAYGSHTVYHPKAPRDRFWRDFEIALKRYYKGTGRSLVWSLPRLYTNWTDESRVIRYLG